MTDREPTPLSREFLDGIIRELDRQESEGRRTNYDTRAEFRDAILAAQPEPPKGFVWRDGDAEGGSKGLGRTLQRQDIATFCAQAQELVAEMRRVLLAWVPSEANGEANQGSLPLAAQPLGEPTLEWEFYPDNGHFYVMRKPWSVYVNRDGSSYGDGTGGTAPARLDADLRIDCKSVDAAKSLAARLQAVLDSVSASPTEAPDG